MKPLAAILAWVALFLGFEAYTKHQRLAQALHELTTARESLAAQETELAAAQENGAQVNRESAVLDWSTANIREVRRKIEVARHDAEEARRERNASGTELTELEQAVAEGKEEQRKDYLRLRAEREDASRAVTLAQAELAKADAQLAAAKADVVSTRAKLQQAYALNAPRSRPPAK